LLNYVRKHFSEERLAFVYEAGPTGFGLYDELVAAGHPCLVVAPSMVPTAPGARVKTNRLDSRKLSTALRGGELKSIHVPSRKYRELYQRHPKKVAARKVAPVIERSGKQFRIRRRYFCPKFFRQTFHEFAAKSIQSKLLDHWN